MSGQMECYEVPRLSDEEAASPLAKYYTDYPLYWPSPLQRMVLDAGPMDPADAIPAQDWLSLLQVTGYRKIVYGYCMMPDGSGFYIEYSTTPPDWDPAWRRWYGPWMNFKAGDGARPHGNLRYKLWMPADHWDHEYVNGRDAADGIRSVETLDLGASGDPSSGLASIVHDLDLAEYGLTPERAAELSAHGCRASACWEEFDGPGHHLVLRFSRPWPLGGVENINCEGIGYWARDGQIVRDESTPVDETYLKNVLTHNTVERAHLAQVLPALYEEYHDLPLDAA
ncbi:MAG: hypothetical protein LBR32_10545 [Propionibacteriaceae bacterium]|nr:hypothetical protein [Propionibacteriaceae bacterium]